MALSPLSTPGPLRLRAVPRAPGAAALERARRLRAPLLLALWALLAFEGMGGLVIFFARVAYGSLPGESIHVFAGVALTLAYAVYQWSHWTRVRPFRSQIHYALGLIAACSMALTNLTGLALGWMWWLRRPGGTQPGYPPLLSALHDIGCMLTLTFILSHLGAVLARDRRARELGRPLAED